MSTPTGPPTAAPPADALAAWQAALSSEYAAAFGYGALGPHLTDPAQITAAHTDEQAHRATARATSAQLVAAGATPVQPQANYPLPFPLTDPTAAQQLALRLEVSCAAAWRYLISIDDAPVTLRTSALSPLTESAIRALYWRALLTPATPSVPFPGI